VAQGAVSIGGFAAAGGGARVTKNHPTAGRIPLGALVEREVPSTFLRDGTVSIALNQPDFATASRIVRAINRCLGESAASARDAATVEVAVPADYRERLVDFIAQVGLVTVIPDAPAKVVINERTGTIVVGGNVRITPVAVSHGALTVEVSIYHEVWQPAPFSERGHTVVRPVGEATAEESEATLAEVGGTTLQELVRSLNAIKVTPRDLVAILQAIKQAGALQAELEIL
jgi:flagellar P-ring protein precursor FlgI